MPQRADDFVAELQRRISALESQVKTLQSAPRLRHASLDDAPLPVKDRDGQVVQVIGRQSDGSFGNRVIKAGPQPRPTGFTVTPGVGSMQITWGGDAEGAIPEAFGRIEVRAGFGDDSTPADAEHLSSIYSREGGSTYVRATPGVWRIWLVMVGPDGRTESAWSESVTVSIEALVDESDIESWIQSVTDGDLSDAAYDSLAARLGQFIRLRAVNLEAGEIQTQHLAVGALDGQIITGALVQSSLHPQRGAKMTGEGFVAYDEEGRVAVWIDGEQVRLVAPSTLIEGDVQARTLRLRGPLSVGEDSEGRITPGANGRMHIEGRLPTGASPRATFTAESTAFINASSTYNRVQVTYGAPAWTGTRMPLITVNIAGGYNSMTQVDAATQSRSGSGFTALIGWGGQTGLPRFAISYLGLWADIS